MPPALLRVQAVFQVCGNFAAAGLLREQEWNRARNSLLALGANQSAVEGRYGEHCRVVTEIHSASVIGLCAEREYNRSDFEQAIRKEDFGLANPNLDLTARKPRQTSV